MSGPGRTAAADAEVNAIVARLGLVAHPEGGFYRETFRAALEVSAPQGPRAASTSIYFLLPPTDFSAFHRVRSDEIWHLYDGDPLELHMIDERAHTIARLGRDLAAGERPQHVVRAGVLQAAFARGPRHALCGCTVAPGFDFADFEMPSRAELLTRMPELGSVIERLTR